MDTWIEHLDNVKQFIASNGKKPPKTTSIGNWLCDQLGFLRNNKGWVANPNYTERKAMLTQFIADNEHLFLSGDDIWKNKLREVDEYITTYKCRHAYNHPLTIWTLAQIKQEKTGKMPASRLDFWNEFMNKHSAYFLSDDEIWENNLSACKQFITRENKRPSSSSTDTEEKRLGEWIVNQIQAIDENHKRYSVWTQFVSDNSNLFISDEDNWNNKFNELNNCLSTNQTIDKSLGTWVQHQKQAYKDGKMPATRVPKWEEYMQRIGQPVVIAVASETPIAVKSKTQCKGRDRNGNICRNYVCSDETYCKFHTYMLEYSDEEISAFQFCKGCQKWKPIAIDKRQCETCQIARPKYKAEYNARSHANIVYCKYGECKNKKSVINDYCGIHQLQVFVDECVAEGKRPCAKYIKGCREKLETHYKRSSCEDCLKKERERDHKNRHGITSDVINNMKQCSVCCIIKTVDHFKASNSSEEQLTNCKGSVAPLVQQLSPSGGSLHLLTKTCIQCRTSNKIQDAKRDKEHRNELARKAEQKPERKAVKQEWKEQNYEKVAETLMNYRNRQIEIDQEAYLKKQADNMKNWRNNNPEKVAEINEKQKTNVKTLYKNHLERIFRCNRENEYNIELFEMTIMMSCYYCGTPSNECCYNGIDRFDNTKGYLLNNTVTACTECNMLKGCLHGYVFWKRILHILSYHHLIDNETYFPEVFPNSSSISYNDYKKRALKKNLIFNLTSIEFINIIDNPCYICGKRSDENHKNGLDRINNNEGYIKTNVKSCCSECNYMKKTLLINKFFDKLLLIYNNLKDEMNINNTYDHHNKIILTNTNKKTEAEIKAEQQAKKEARRKAQRDKYSNEEWKKLHAAELAEKRKQKRNTFE
jgi:hypothetical protein